MKDQRAPKHLLRPGYPKTAPKHAGRVINVQADSTVNDVINNALGIIKQQVDTLSAKSRLGGSLPDTDVKNLRTYIQSLVELSREERERTKAEGVEEWLSKLTVEELIELAQGRLGAVAANEGAIEAKAEIVAESVSVEVPEPTKPK